GSGDSVCRNQHRCVSHLATSNPWRARAGQSTTVRTEGPGRIGRKAHIPNRRDNYSRRIIGYRRRASLVETSWSTTYRGTGGTLTDCNCRGATTGRVNRVATIRPCYQMIPSNTWSV